MSTANALALNTDTTHFCYQNIISAKFESRKGTITETLNNTSHLNKYDNV